jgi:molecular chaperone GrpE
MNPESDLQNQSIEQGDMENVASFDDFLKELEEAEKSLHISNTDTVFEIEESFDDSPTVDVGAQSAAEEFALETFSAPPSSSPKSIFGGSPAMENGAARQELNDLRAQMTTLREEREELHNMLRRRQTDFDNFRKRTERERSETFENILSKLSSKMLPVLDNLNRALESADKFSNTTPEFMQFTEGIMMVSQQLSDVLFEMGVQRIVSVGNAFDPNFHEAVATLETGDAEPGTVMEELLSGYTIGKQVIRPAMVRVSKALPTAVSPVSAPVPEADEWSAFVEEEIHSVDEDENFDLPPSHA